jgi:transcription antitermination factor NusG
MQWHGMRQCPGVIRPVRIGDDEPVHVPDAVIDALRARERDGAIDLLQHYNRRTWMPTIGERVRVRSGRPFEGKTGIVADVAGRRVDVLLLMLGSQRRVQLRQNAIEPC